MGRRNGFPTKGEGRKSPNPFDFRSYNLYLPKNFAANQDVVKILKPRKLARGDLIGIVSPASPVVDSSSIDAGVHYLEKSGYSVLVGKSVGRSDGYLAGTDEERVSDLHTMFRDRRVKAIICVRGGYGTPRVLPSLDYALIARNPKILVGFSDITALQLALWRKCRLITIQGPMLAVDMAGAMDPQTEELFWRTITSRHAPGRLGLPDYPDARVLSPGISTGRMLGGNLSMIVSLLGTPYQPDFANKVLFFEEVAEEPYRIDRMLTQLRNASVLSCSKGILAGQFVECVPKDTSRPSLSVDQILSRLAAGYPGPFVSNLQFGHVPKKATIAVGVMVRIDSNSGTIDCLEAAVA